MANIKLRVSPGKAYVNGYKISKNLPTFLSVSKATATEAVINETVGTGYGNYILVSSLLGIPDISLMAPLTIKNAVNWTGAIAGTCRVRAIEKENNIAGVAYRLYIFDVQMTGSYQFDVSAFSIGATVGSQDSYVNIFRENNRSVIHNSNNRSLIFPLPKPRAKSVSNLSLYQQKRYTTTLAAGTTQVTIAGGSGEVFVDISDWIAINAAGTPQSITVTSGSLNSNSATITGFTQAVNDQIVTVIAYTYKAVATLAAKTLQTGNRSYTVAWTAGQQDVVTDMLELDVVDISEIRYNNSTGDIITDKFVLDNGAKDAYYETSKLRLKNNHALSTTTIWVNFTYYEHGQGDYYAPNSYSSGTGSTYDYGNIPTYTMENGDVVDLKDCIDLRPSKGTTGNFSNNSAVPIPIPKQASVLTFDVEYYLPRFDKLVLEQDGQMKYIEGTPAFSPIFPDIPQTAMELYRVKVNPYTLSSKDLTFSMIENKRYTMRDIGKIENRLERFEEMVTLSLLEMDTKNIEVLDENGLPRTKTGFIADNFADQSYTDFNNIEYNASIDPKEKFARPSFSSNNIGLIYDQTLSTNTVLVGDNVYLAYTHADYIGQDLASGTENVNPFMTMGFRGHIKLSPSSDDWKEVEYLGQKVIDGGTRLNTNSAHLWNEHEWNWSGSDLNGLDVGSSTNSRSIVVGETGFTNTTGNNRTGGTITRGVNRTTQTTVNTVVSSETIREVIGDRLVQWAFIPFMRSRLVYFRGEGFQPNTKMFAFFDGIDVADWVKQETYVSFNSHKATEFGNTQLNANGHPNGKSDLYTDGNGIVQGSFFVPSTSAIRFPTGSAEFKLIDITADNEANAISYGSAVYSASGVLDTRQEDILSTRWLEVVGNTSTNTSRVVTSRTAIAIVENRAQDGDGNQDRMENTDPLAQSFTVHESTGVFITKVSLYFKTKSTTMPVWIQIRPMINGYPASDIIVPGSQKLLTSAQVATSLDATLATDFIFDEPIYLKGYTDYAVVCLTDNTDYLLYVSSVGEFVLGTTNKKINRQPFLGSLFKSQNSKTWEASQWQDMKFKLHRASFTSTTGQAVFKNATVPNRLLKPNAITLFAKPTERKKVKVEAKNHGLLVGDSVVLSGVVDSTYATFLNNGGTAHTVTEVDGHSFAFNQSSLPVVTVPRTTGGNAIQITQQYAYNSMFPNLESISPKNTSINFTQIGTSGKSYAGSESPYAHYALEPLRNKANNYFEFPRIIAHATREDQLVNDTSLLVHGNIVTGSNFVSPVIDLQRCGVSIFENIIDNPEPVTSSTSGTNNVVFDVDDTVSGNEGYSTYKAETDALAGSTLAKHITKSISLLSPASGLKIFMAVNKPSAANVELYYKAIMDSVSFDSVPWVQATLDTAMPSDDDGETFREYIYTEGGDTGTLPTFNRFKVKIVFTSSNSSKVPMIRDFRAISLGD
jgi:hypothetical protein